MPKVTELLEETPDPVVAPEEEPQAIPPQEEEQAFPQEEEAPPPDPLSGLEERLEAAFDRRFAMLEQKMGLLALRAVETALPAAVRTATNEAQAIANSKPPMTLRANVADNFIGMPGKVAHLGHYRCERHKAVKVQEFDMEQWRAFERGDAVWPRDKLGRKIKLQNLCAMQGAFIPFLDGHCYPTTQNQLDCLMLYKHEISEQDGGMPDLYEDTSIEPFRCHVCQSSNDMWPTREGYQQHMLHVHGVVEQAA